MHWRRLNGQKLQGSIEDIVKDILIDEISNGYKMKVCVGTDSQVRGGTVEFASVIVFLREKRGGFMLIRNKRLNNRFSLRERLLTEVSDSIEVAYDICHTLDDFDVDMEVHADINTNPQFKSNATLHDAMGYILGMGFAFKAKPDAFASTSCANKVV